MATTKAWMNANLSIWEKPLSLFPGLNGVANMTMSIIDQDYGGDITIVNPPRLWSLAKVLSQLSLEEMADLIATGEVTSWPKIEMIRTQTRISRTLSLASTASSAWRCRAGGTPAPCDDGANAK